MSLRDVIRILEDDARNKSGINLGYIPAVLGHLYRLEEEEWMRVSRIKERIQNLDTEIYDEWEKEGRVIECFKLVDVADVLRILEEELG